LSLDYTPSEMMVCAAAREIKDGERIFVGMRLPLLAFLVALGTHAPKATGIFENGVIRNTPAEAPFVTMGDPPNIQGAISCGSMSEVMGLLQSGRIQVGLVGGAEVDIYGNLNTTLVESQGKAIRLPGSGGGADIACLAGRLIILLPHEKRRFKPVINYLTSPGFGQGPGWRKSKGLIGGGPRAIITNLCIFDFDPQTSQARVKTLHPGVEIDQVRERTGFEFRLRSDLATTPPPTDEELGLVRRYDPEGFWTR
jgi:glutaconate CoA-transferase, subunit B